MKVLSQELIPSFGPQMSVEMNSGGLDSGCGTESNTESLQPTSSVEKGQAESSASVLTLPRQPHFPLPSTDPRESALLSRMQFLQNLCGLRKLGACGPSLDGHGAVVWDSVCQLLSTLLPAPRDDQCHLQQDLLLQASQVVAQVVDEWKTRCKPLGPFLTQAEDCLKRLTNHLLNNSQLNRASQIHVSILWG